jgi:hypothetical protein
MSDITSAVSTTTQESASAAATLISYYANCNVAINDLKMSFKEFDGV